VYAERKRSVREKSRGGAAIAWYQSYSDRFSVDLHAIFAGVSGGDLCLAALIFSGAGMTCCGAARVAVAALIDAIISRTLVRFRE
jgi:hypothetical protein